MYKFGSRDLEYNNLEIIPHKAVSKTLPIINNTLGMNFVHIKPGTFNMGSPEELALSNHEKLHKVTLTKAFYLQKAEVTVGQWRHFAEEDGYKTEAEKENWSWCHAKKNWKIPGILPAWSWQKKPGGYWDNPGFYQTESHPVTCVSWNDTQAFIKWLNRKDKKKYRLPTEAEWEYACRAGSETTYSFGECISKKHVNYNTQRFETVKFLLKKNRTQVAGYYPVNPWGLYNMHGNVWEWCEDYCEWNEMNKEIITDTYVDNVSDSICKRGNGRIMRGGSWFYSKTSCRSSHRRHKKPNERASGVGFRLVIDIY